MCFKGYIKFKVTDEDRAVLQSFKERLTELKKLFCRIHRKAENETEKKISGIFSRKLVKDYDKIYVKTEYRFNNQSSYYRYQPLTVARSTHYNTDIGGSVNVPIVVRDFVANEADVELMKLFQHDKVYLTTELYDHYQTIKEYVKETEDGI